MKTENSKIAMVLDSLKLIIYELNKLPKLKYNELTSELNNLLWCLDGIQEAKDRIKQSTSFSDILFYQQKISERNTKINKDWLYILN
jgi:hypothetical protein